MLMTQNYTLTSYQIEKNLNTTIRFLKHYSAGLIYMRVKGNKWAVFLN